MKYYNNNNDNKSKKNPDVLTTKICSEVCNVPFTTLFGFKIYLYIYLFCAETAIKAGKCPDHRKSIFINMNAVNKEEPSVVLDNRHKKDREKRFRMASKKK